MLPGEEDYVMADTTEVKIFKKGSTTFFLSSVFFPKDIKTDVFDLYSFVRVADDYVDQVPADKEGFQRLRKLWEDAAIDPNFSVERNDHDSIDETVTKNIVRVARKRHFDMDWVDAFLDAMQSDIVHKEYTSIEGTLNYVYGSAEVIGLMMAQIMDLEPDATEAARMQGRAMQIINFIRDIDEDNTLGRQYFPVDDLKKFDLPDLTLESTTARPTQFNEFIQFQLDRYDAWQAQAAAGYHYIPRRYRIPIKTAADMYNATAETIRQNPFIVYEKKVKPSKTRIIIKALKNILTTP
jgi:15-cis-phytoene synthase